MSKFIRGQKSDMKDATFRAFITHEAFFTDRLVSNSESHVHKNKGRDSYASSIINPTFPFPFPSSILDAFRVLPKLRQASGVPSRTYVPMRISQVIKNESISSESAIENS